MSPAAAPTTSTTKAVFEQYRTKVGEIRHRPPTTGSVLRKPSEVEHVLHSLENLGLEPPAIVAEAIDRWHRLRSPRRAQRADRRAKVRAEISAGKVDVDTAAAQLAELDLEHAPDSVRLGARRSARRTADRAYFEAVALLAELADTIVVDQLRPVAEACLDDPSPSSEERWRAVHDLAAFMRKVNLAPDCGATRTEHMVRRPDLVHHWRLAHAESVFNAGGCWEREGTVWVTVNQPRGTPPITLAVVAEHRDEWGARIYTAAEVVENVAAMRAEHERMLDEAAQLVSVHRRSGPRAVSSRTRPR